MLGPTIFGYGLFLFGLVASLGMAIWIRDREKKQIFLVHRQIEAMHRRAAAVKSSISANG